MSENTCNNWFKNWFNSSYYHVLYKHRNYSEAENFITKLIDFLQPQKNARFLDLACGKGRHALFLNKKGFDVTGIDLSSESILQASAFENEHLKFFIHDMRKPFRINYFNYVLNLFTSFGYFEKEKDDNATISAINKALAPNGIFVLDFMNSEKVVANLKQNETILVDDISFNITKKIENNFIVKQISFTDKNKNYNFEERVKALTLNDFENYFNANNLKIVHLFGNYNLEEFNKKTSDRLIIVAQKIT